MNELLKVAAIIIGVPLILALLVFLGSSNNGSDNPYGD